MKQAKYFIVSLYLERDGEYPSQYHQLYHSTVEAENEKSALRKVLRCVNKELPERKITLKLVSQIEIEIDKEP